MKFSTNWHFNNTVCELTPKKIEDKRGFFSEVYHQHFFEEIGIKEQFIQENYSYSKKQFTFRGLHFQNPPFEQAKLVRVLKGSVLDIVVDLRENSDSYLQHKIFELSQKNFKQVFIPVGFAHGFLTLEKDCEISYKVTNIYDAASDISLSVFDEALDIEMPCSRNQITLSDKDKNATSIKTLDKLFFI